MTSSSRPVGPIERFMAEDHAHIDRLLEAAAPKDGPIDDAVYLRFRHALLRHIGMEEKILLPFARTKRGGRPLPIAPKLRADHGDIAKLLVRSPTPDIAASLRELLGRHNPIEEGPGGLYALCDELAHEESSAIEAQLRTHPEVPLAKYYDGPMHR